MAAPATVNEDLLDLRNDPMPISLGLPALMDLGLLALMDLNPDPSLAGVTFESPTKIIETDLRISGASSDSSSSSRSSSS